MINRVAVITGAASGIGLALAKHCLCRGLRVVMVDIDSKKLCTSIAALDPVYQAHILGQTGDVTQLDSLQSIAKVTIDTFNRIDWVFNNAGICNHLAPIWELSEAHIRQVMEINVYGVMNGIKAFFPFLEKQAHRSRLINMASFYGLCSGSRVAPYAMSKHAILALSESLYFDLQRYEKPIDVSVIFPSFINTDLLNNSLPHGEESLHHLMARLMTNARPAEDVARNIIEQIEKNYFYILPDNEVKDYCQQRTDAILYQEKPSLHSMEKIVMALDKRLNPIACT